MAERKNKHLLEVARALLFTTNVPKYFWGEAVLMATHLINCMLSKVLGFKSPLHVLQNFFPNSKITSSLPLKIFGCTVFIRNTNTSRGKLDPRAKKCVFVGFAPTKKGYKCYDPISKKLFVTMDVSFFENTPYFHPHLQGERGKEDSVDDDGNFFHDGFFKQNLNFFPTKAGFS